MSVVYKEDARKAFLDNEGNVDWNKVEDKLAEQKKIKLSLVNKHYTK